MDKALKEGADVLQDVLIGDIMQQGGAPMDTDDADNTAAPTATVATVKQEKTRICDSCGAAAKYRCPACKRESCSLPCVKQHKEAHACDGKKKPVHVALANYGEKELIDDYHFLESFNDVLFKVHKSLPTHQPFSFETLPTPLFYLREAAKNRGLHLTLQSQGMARRCDNLTRFNTLNDTILWRVDFVVHQGDETTTLSRLVNERHILGEVIENMTLMRERKLKKHAVWNQHWEQRRRRREQLREQEDELPIPDVVKGAHTGIVRKWDDNRGFGFISVDGQDSEVFVHKHSLQMENERAGSLTVGVSCLLDIEDDNGRPRAANVSGEAVCAFGKAGPAVRPQRKKILNQWTPPTHDPPKYGPDGRKTCDFFWRSGKCKHSERCSFAHLAPADYPTDATGDVYSATLRSEHDEALETTAQYENLCDELEGITKAADTAPRGEAELLQELMAEEPVEAPQAQAPEEDYHESDEEGCAVEEDHAGGGHDDRYRRERSRWSLEVDAMRRDSRTSEKRHALRQFVKDAKAQERGGCRAFVKANRLGIEVAYQPLDTSITVAENLKHVRFIIEYPTIDLYLPDEADTLPVLTEEHKEQQKARWQLTNQKTEQPDLTPQERRKMRKIPCKFFSQRGRCNNDDECIFMHTFELAYCKTLQNLGFCPLKEKCCFSHRKYDADDPENRRKIPRDLRDHFASNTRDRARDVRDVRAEIHARANNLPLPTPSDEPEWKRQKREREAGRGGGRDSHRERDHDRDRRDTRRGDDRRDDRRRDDYRRDDRRDDRRGGDGYGRGGGNDRDNRDRAPRDDYRRASDQDTRRQYPSDPRQERPAPSAAPWAAP